MSNRAKAVMSAVAMMVGLGMSACTGDIAGPSSGITNDVVLPPEVESANEEGSGGEGRGGSADAPDVLR